MIIRYLSIILTTTALVGCDGYILVKGQVYEWNNPPSNASAIIIVDKEAPLEYLDITPLDSTIVTLFHGGDYSKTPLAENTIWQTSRNTDREGSFEIGDVTAPHEFTAIIRAQKDGYQKVETKFLHDKREHKAIILLIKK